MGNRGPGSRMCLGSLIMNGAEPSIGGIWQDDERQRGAMMMPR